VINRSRRPLAIDGAPLASQPWEEEVLRRALGDASLLVDATTRGMNGVDQPPLPLDALPVGAAVVDLAVRRSTPLSAAAHARGLKAACGAAMLVRQGADAFELWTGRPAPIEVMRAALERSLDAR
jgi:shikimate dehydrogenase